MNGVLCWDCNTIIFYLQCKIVGPEIRQTVHNGGSWFPEVQIFCRNYFLPTDFTTPEGIRLNRSAAPHGLDSASHPIPVFSVLATYPFQLTTLSSKFSEQ